MLHIFYYLLSDIYILFGYLLVSNTNTYILISGHGKETTLDPHSDIKINLKF